MQADNKVVLISLSDVPAIPLYERDRGQNVAVAYVLVRTDYEEKDEDAVKRAHRIADYLTDGIARKKTERISK